MRPIYATIFKVDERTREVSGRATQEVVDRDGECMDYASSKPEFMRWSAEVFNDTGGKSHGNVRSMHGNTAAGKLTDIQFLDDERAIDITAKIVDDNEWEKICEGVYGGFSIGGRYARKWNDVSSGKPLVRYTAVPSEISIVDRPSCPTAKFFSVHKRDGSIVRRRFATNNFVDAFNHFHTLMEKHSMSNTSSIDAIRKIHAQGAQPLAKDFLHKYQPADLTKNRTVMEIRKVHNTVRGNHQIDMDGIFKMARRSAALRKTTFPPNSSNGQWGGATANTGAGNNWNDEGTVGAAGAKPTRIGGQVIGTPSKTNMQAALDAIKQDMARGAKRMGV